MREIDKYRELILIQESILDELYHEKDNLKIEELSQRYYDVQYKIERMKEKTIWKKKKKLK